MLLHITSLCTFLISFEIQDFGIKIAGIKSIPIFWPIFYFYHKTFKLKIFLPVIA